MFARGLLATAIGFATMGSAPAFADQPTWSTFAITARASQAPAVVAGADKFMASEIGQTFKGRLLLMGNTIDGNNPATHSFVVLNHNTAQAEAWSQSLPGKPAWAAFQNTMEKNTQPVGSVRYRVLKSWSDVNNTDGVWMTHAFNVSDAAKFVAAIDKLMASALGQKFPGQVHLSATVAGGGGPGGTVSHVITVGYASEAEMAQWLAMRDGSPDWAAYQEASGPASNYLGGALSRQVKAWGPATLPDIVKQP